MDDVADEDVAAAAVGVHDGWFAGAVGGGGGLCGIGSSAPSGLICRAMPVTAATIRDRPGVSLAVPDPTNG